MFLSNIGVPFKVDVGSKYQDISTRVIYILLENTRKINIYIFNKRAPVKITEAPKFTKSVYRFILRVFR